jgi:hypothetical protein
MLTIKTRFSFAAAACLTVMTMAPAAMQAWWDSTLSAA